MLWSSSFVISIVLIIEMYHLIKNRFKTKPVELRPMIFIKRRELNPSLENPQTSVSPMREFF
jgi:hypothetical protein